MSANVMPRRIQKHPAGGGLRRWVLLGMAAGLGVVLALMLPDLLRYRRIMQM